MKQIRIVISVLLVWNGYIYAPNTQADKTFAEQLFKRVEADRGIGFTQTEAQLSLKEEQDKVKELDGLAMHEKIIRSALVKERIYFKDYYVFYSAIPYGRLFQDVARKLYKKSEP